MTIDWNAFTPSSALAGGTSSASRSRCSCWSTGASPVSAASWAACCVRAPRRRVAAAFMAGLVAAPLVCALVSTAPAAASTRVWPVLVAAGLAVGIGTRYAGGCTSGHGVCGLARLSPRSLAATASFMGTGVATVFVMRHVVAGSHGARLRLPRRPALRARPPGIGLAIRRRCWASSTSRALGPVARAGHGRRDRGGGDRLRARPAPPAHVARRADAAATSPRDRPPLGRAASLRRGLGPGRLLPGARPRGARRGLRQGRRVRRRDARGHGGLRARSSALAADTDPGHGVRSGET